MEDSNMDSNVSSPAVLRKEGAMPGSCGRYCALCRVKRPYLSMFAIPSNPDRARQWLDVLPRGIQRKARINLCEKHFREEDIERKRLFRNAEGKVVGEHHMLRARLKEGAVPQIRPDHTYTRAYTSDSSAKNSGPAAMSPHLPDHTYVKGPWVVDEEQSAVASTQEGKVDENHRARGVVISFDKLLRRKLSKRSIQPDRSPSDTPTSPCPKTSGNGKITQPSIQPDRSPSDTPTSPCPETSGNGKITQPSIQPDHPQSDIAELSLPYHASDGEKQTCDDDSGQDIVFSTPACPSQDSPSMGQEAVAEETSKCAVKDFKTLMNLYKNSETVTLPPHWNRIVPVKGPIMVCYSQLVSHERDRNRHGVPGFHKSISADENGKITCSVVGVPLDIEKLRLPHDRLQSMKHLGDLIFEFDKVQICEGSMLRGDLTRAGSTASAFIDCLGYIRHKDCDLVVDHVRMCVSCKSIRKRQLASILQAEKTVSVPQQKSPALTPKRQTELQSLRKLKLRFKARKLRARMKVRGLQEEICSAQLEMAAMNDKSVEDMLAQLPSHERTTVAEIVAASKAQDANGRWYTEDWILLCLLLHIRSISLYNSLRNNQGLPLPCRRTICKYLATINNTPCGFDPNFFDMFKKYLDQKSDIQRHGVVLFDEVSVRESLSVCSKTLTYKGLRDFGERDVQGTDMAERATHALVFMFQPLAAQYTQAIGMFASKGPVKGTALAQIIIKVITLLEKSGAKIHGLVSDGAQTDHEVWSLLGISGKLQHPGSDEWNNLFEHPMDPKRCIFVFFDTPSLVKSVRNRLYQEQELVICPNSTPAKWQHFVMLHEQDLLLPAEIRVCPSVTSDHLVLNSSSAKMRVRLATQILSKSVADGLEFYAAQGVRSLEDCLGTVNLCRVMSYAFDALNRKVLREGITSGSTDYKVLESTLQWLSDWEKGLQEGQILPGQFLSSSTAEGLRVTLQSTIRICLYLKDKFEFNHLPSGRINQDALERCFGAVRLAEGSNDHPATPTFLQLYKLLSVRSLLKPPKCGNCSTNDDTPTEPPLKLSHIQEIFSQGTPEPSVVEALKEKLTLIVETKEWEFPDIVEHDYTCAPVVECATYYVTGYLAKQIFKYSKCDECRSAFISTATNSQQIAAELFNLRTHGKLIHPHNKLFNFIRSVETCFAKYCSQPDAYERTVEEVLDTCDLSFPCGIHKVDTMTFAVKYYLNMRMRQWTTQTRGQEVQSDKDKISLILHHLV